MGCDGLRMAHGLAVPADRVLQDQSALSCPRELVLGSQSTPGADAASRARWLQGIYSPGVLVLLPGGVPTWSAAVHAHRAWDAGVGTPVIGASGHVVGYCSRRSYDFDLFGEDVSCEYGRQPDTFPRHE